MQEFNPISRRRFLRLAEHAAAMGVLMSVAPRWASAQDLPHLAESDATASALGYREDATKVDAAKAPTHKAGQICANCRFFGGSEKTAFAACQLFPGKAVAAKGWCSGYNAKA